MKTTLYLDIETIPGPESGKAATIAKPPGNMKKQETIDKWHTDHGEAAIDDLYRKQSFNGGYGQICSFSFAVGDLPVCGVMLAGDRSREKDILTDAFWGIQQDLDDVGDPNPFLCGHYISGFDLRFIMHRCIVLGISVPTWLRPNAKPWDAGMRDTMLMWAGNRDTIGLDELCKILGIEGKGDMDGSQVYDYWLAGRHDEISAYCNADVEKVRAIDLKFKAAGL